MIGTDENRAVLYVEVIFWSGKRKTPPSLMSGKYCPHFVVKGTTEYLGVCFLDGDECAFDEPALGNAQPLYPDTIDYAPLENNAEFSGECRLIAKWQSDSSTKRCKPLRSPTEESVTRFGLQP